MTKKDKKLLILAEKLTPVEWATADLYAEEADSKETARELNKIASVLYREEEAQSNLL